MLFIVLTCSVSFARISSAVFELSSSRFRLSAMSSSAVRLIPLSANSPMWAFSAPISLSLFSIWISIVFDMLYFFDGLWHYRHNKISHFFRKEQTRSVMHLTYFNQHGRSKTAMVIGSKFEKACRGECGAASLVKAAATRVSFVIEVVCFLRCAWRKHCCWMRRGSRRQSQPFGFPSFH